MEAQVSLTVAFRSSALLGLVSLIFLLTIPTVFYASLVEHMNHTPGRAGGLWTKKMRVNIFFFERL